LAAELEQYIAKYL